MALESLEPRYAMDAANDDFAFGQYAVVQNPVQIDVLDDNDDFSAAGRITMIGVEAVPVAVGTPHVFTLPHGTVSLRSNHRVLDYTPNSGVTGLKTFTYEATDGILSGSATVTVDIDPVAIAGDLSGYTMDEGSLLTLDGSLSLAPGVVNYFWSINSVPLDSTDTTLPTLNVPWSELNDLGILDGNVSATVGLRIVDGNGEEDLETTSLSVLNIAPVISNFQMTPAPSGCGGADYVLTATFTDPNPLDYSNSFTVSIDWDAFDVGAAPQVFPITGTGTVALSVPHTYLSAGNKVPRLQVTANGLGGADPAETATAFLDDFFLTVTLGTGDPIAAEILGAPPTGVEGTAIALEGDATASCDGTITAYAWEVFKDDVSTGQTGAISTFNFTPRDNGTYVVKLTVTDSNSATKTVESTPIIVSNAGPVLGAVTAAQPVAGGPNVTVSGTISDAGIDDTLTVSIVWETGGTPESITVVGSNGSFSYSASHTYTTPGSKAIVVYAEDDDGGPASGSAAASVQAALSTTGTLAILGTGGGDNVSITSAGGVIEVQGSLLGGPITFSAGSVSLLKLDLGEGDDSLLVGSSVTATVLAFGGGGNDVMAGGGGSNVLVGGAGIDLLTGRGARDILIGGTGYDVLGGGAGQDILIDGETTNDANETALLAILDEWKSGDDSLTSFQRRVRRLSGLESGGLNGSYIILTLDNATLDILLGGAGNDWLIGHGGDISFG